jgi:hypothetical protein
MSLRRWIAIASVIVLSGVATVAIGSAANREERLDATAGLPALDGLAATAWLDGPDPRLSLLSSVTTRPWLEPVMCRLGGIAERSAPGRGASLATLARSSALGEGSGGPEAETALRVWSTWRSGGGWLGVSRPVSRVASARPTFELGGWRRMGALSISAAIQQGSVLIVGATRLARAEAFVAETTLVDTGVVHYPALWEQDRDHERATAFLTSIEWRRGWLSLSSQGGLTIAKHRRPSRWARADVAASLHPGLAWFASVGPPVLRFSALDRPEPVEVRAGVRLTASAESFQASRRGATRAETTDAPATRPALRAIRLRSGDCALRVRALRVRSVEIAGDMTDWAPVRLSRAARFEWEVRLPMRPGVYRVRMRLDDGDWGPPDGLPTAIDLEGQAVGMLVVD